jgi:hypothetical protein
MTRRKPFGKLISIIQKDAMRKDSNGNFTILPGSSTNILKMKQSSWKPPELHITSDDLNTIWERQNGLCYWFKIPLDLNLLYKDHIDYYKRHPLAPSVDRLDNDGHYTIDNVVICSRFANMGRGPYPADRFQLLINSLKENWTGNNHESF